MMSLENWLIFCSIAFVATVTPGPAVLLVTSHSLSQGPLRSVATILGNISGLFCMSLASVMGLSSLIMYSTNAFLVVKVIGALYLIYLGVRLWRQGFNLSAGTVAKAQKTSLLRLYMQGVMVSLTNPKAIAFTTALFPQFIDASAPLAWQFSVLVLTFMLFSFGCLLGYAIVSSRAKARSAAIGAGASAGRWLGKLFGSAFVGSGLALAFASQK